MSKTIVKTEAKTPRKKSSKSSKSGKGLNPKDLLVMVESISNERGIDKDSVFEAVEAALAAVAAKNYPEEDQVRVRVAIDRESGEYETFRNWIVVPDEEEGEFPEREIIITEAKKIDKNLELNDVVEESIPNADFGRIAAQAARQIIFQKVREAERNKIATDYENRVGQLVTGTVKRTGRDHVVLDLGENAEALMSREEMLPREAFRLNDRVRAYLYGVRNEKRGPQLLISRTCPEFLIELFKIEVPEIGEEVIEIKAAARDPGSRAKIAVKTNDGRMDPIGACVGMRGSRVQAVSNELGGERIDIVLWDANPAQLVINAMAPAEVLSIVADEETKTMDIAVAEDQLSQAIGRSGQNVRLAGQLTGWTLNVMSEDAATQKQASEQQGVKDLFIKELGVEASVADTLTEAGFTTLEEIAYIPAEEMQQIEGFDAAFVADLQRRAGDMLLARELAGDVNEASDELSSVAGITPELIEKFQSNGIRNREELAEQAVDDLVDLGVDAKVAAKLIMTARAHWFANE